MLELPVGHEVLGVGLLIEAAAPTELLVDLREAIAHVIGRDGVVLERLKDDVLDRDIYLASSSNRVIVHRASSQGTRGPLEDTRK